MGTAHLRSTGRDVLPVPDIPASGLVTYDAKDPDVLRTHRADWTQFEDVSANHPGRLHELQRLFLIEATRDNVLPLDDRAAERIMPEVAAGRLSESSVVSIKNRSHSVTAEIVVPDGGAQGVIVAEDYPTPNAFTGEVRWVEIDVDDAAVDADHRLDPDELLRVAMARQ